MKDPMDQTAETYKSKFDNYVKGTSHTVTGAQKEWLEAFAALLPSHADVFELGSAFGRDAEFLRDAGFTVFCTDIIPDALVSLEKKGFEVAEYDFRAEPNPEWLHAFDGVLASAVLLHATKKSFDDVFSHVLSIAKPGGIVAFSLKVGEGDGYSIAKMEAPRFFSYWQEDELRMRLGNCNVEVVSLRTTSDGKWLHAIARIASD